MHRGWLKSTIARGKMHHPGAAILLAASCYGIILVSATCNSKGNSPNRKKMASRFAAV